MSSKKDRNGKRGQGKRAVRPRRVFYTPISYCYGLDDEPEDVVLARAVIPYAEYVSEITKAGAKAIAYGGSLILEEAEAGLFSDDFVEVDDGNWISADELVAAGYSVPGSIREIDDIDMLQAFAHWVRCLSLVDLTIAEEAEAGGGGDDRGELADDVLDTLIAFFEENVGTGAVVTYTGSFPGQDGVVRSVEGDFDLIREEDGVFFTSVWSNETFDYLVLLGVGGMLSLTVRCFEDEIHPLTDMPRSTVYGWRVERGGLSGISEADMFNAFCVDANTGEPLPPETGVEYGSTDDFIKSELA